MLIQINKESYICIEAPEKVWYLPEGGGRGGVWGVWPSLKYLNKESTTRKKGLGGYVFVKFVQDIIYSL